MDITLTPEMEAMIREQVASGRYASPSDVVREAMRLWEAEERNRDWLREQLQIGVDDIARGNVVVVDDAYWDELEREVEARIARDGMT